MSGKVKHCSVKPPGIIIDVWKGQTRHTCSIFWRMRKESSSGHRILLLVFPSTRDPLFGQSRLEQFIVEHFEREKMKPDLIPVGNYPLGCVKIPSECKVFLFKETLGGGGTG
uniref:Uncharacterized protein n=1 Tax=Cacopsylla melanoneura TaxID=428564 RepID=A0A8D9BB41_9HEMI